MLANSYRSKGTYGETFAHRDIAIDFYAWVFPEKRYELVKLIAGKVAFFESLQREIRQMKKIETDIKAGMSK